jgi:hypothetical protein
MKLFTILFSAAVSLSICFSSAAQEAQPAKVTTTKKDSAATLTPKSTKKNKKTKSSANQVKITPAPVIKGAPIPTTEADAKDTKTGKDGMVHPNSGGIPEVKGSTPIITDSRNGSINWTQQYITAKGSSVLDTVRFKNPAQARMMATRGAMVVAQRNLLEIIKGVEVTSETTVQDMVATNDYVYTRLDGVIKGAQQVGEPVVKDGMIELTMRVPMYETNGLAPVLYDNLPATPKAVNVGQRGIVADEPEPNLEKIAFNFAGKKLSPSMFPVIVDENNNLVLDMSKIYNPKNGKFPKIVQATKELLNEAGYKNAVKIIDVIDSKDGKIVINNESVKKINWSKIGKTAATIGKYLLMLI